MFITSEEAEQGINPMDINKGMRSYRFSFCPYSIFIYRFLVLKLIRRKRKNMKTTLRCQSSSCRHLKFSSLDGPQVLHLVIICKHLVKTSISQVLKEYIYFREWGSTCWIATQRAPLLLLADSWSSWSFRFLVSNCDVHICQNIEYSLFLICTVIINSSVPLNWQNHLLIALFLL